VCPVGATVHDDEGLNVQVYNRCIGTRFCSNNCPYKVRRFNFLQYSNEKRESLKAMQNPEVTVRRRGVMEKCSYCLQRITRARIDAEKQGRRIADGEVVTACQAACPTAAIHFGDLNDPSSGVVAAKASKLDYVLLEELNTRPRTSYAARVVNPDPELE
jgi:molybdopterin-containing oxidoreductase family iron-sulfur binding subunit